MISTGPHSLTTALAFGFGVLLGHQLDWFSIVVLGIFLGGLGFVLLASFGLIELVRGDQA